MKLNPTILEMILFKLSRAILYLGYANEMVAGTRVSCPHTGYSSNVKENTSGFCAQIAGVLPLENMTGTTGVEPSLGTAITERDAGLVAA